MPTRKASRKLVVITAVAVLTGTIGGFGAASFAAGPSNGSQVPGSALPIGAHTSNAPFSSGQIIQVKIPANSVFSSGASINIVECASSVLSATTDAQALPRCDGLTVQGDSVLAASDGSVTYNNYTVYALPDSIALGEPSTNTPKCDTSNSCVLYIGTDQTHPFSSLHFFSQTVVVRPQAGDTGANPGDGSAQTPQTITFTSTAPSSSVVGGPTYTVTATGGGSGNPVVFSSGTPSICSVSGSTVSFVGTGTCTIDANQAGNTQYSAAPQQTQSFAVGKGSQTITFTSTAPSNATVGGPTYTVSATGGASGNPVVFSSGTPSICTVSGSTVSFVGTGTCTVDANQAGNTQYNAAPQAQQSFAVVAAAGGPCGPTATQCITSPSSDTVATGTPFSFSVTTSGSPAPKIKAKGKLPKGVKFQKGVGTATLAGTPTSTKHKPAAGSYNLTIIATFGKGKTKHVVTQAFTLTVTP
jgi:hypothetical protein